MGKKTFSLRRHEVVEKEIEGKELKERWPALFTVDEVNHFFIPYVQLGMF